MSVSTAGQDQRGCAVVLGATSPIAEAFCRQAAGAGYSVMAAARSEQAAQAIAADVAVRSEQTTAAAGFDALDADSIQVVFDRAESELGPVTLALIAFGDMGAVATEDAPEADVDIGNVERVIHVNFAGAAVASEVASLALGRSVDRAVGSTDGGSKPTLIGIASVAGDRGRQSNYPYGSAKGGFAYYLQGLRNRLFQHGIHVVTAKFGFIDTPMTHGMKTAIPIASPEAAASALLKAARKETDVLYFPFFWRFVMLIIRTIPERLFKRLSL